MPAAERYPAAYFVEEVKQWILDDPRFGATPKERRDLLFGGGLRIHTTVDLEVQAQAEAAVAAILPDPNGPDASLVVDRGRHRLRAGDGRRARLLRHEPDRQAQPGHPGPPPGRLVVQALRARHRPHAGHRPAARGSRRRPASRSRCENAEPWRPCNYGGGGGGTVTIAEGTVRSYNTLYAQLICASAPRRPWRAPRATGIMSPLETVPSGVLGSNDVTAMDMAARLLHLRQPRHPGAARARHPDHPGRRHRAVHTTQHRQTKVLEAGVVDTLTSILEQVIERGTGTRAKLDRPAAGKTGTTDDNKDAWFAGYTPELATAVWVGFPSSAPTSKLIPMRPPNTPIAVTGGSYPAQIWQRFMSAALAGRPAAAFPAPTTTTTIRRYVAPPPDVGRRPADRPCPTCVGLHGRARPPRSCEAAGFRVRHRPRARRRRAARAPSWCSSPPAGSSAPRGSMVTLEVAPQSWTARRPTGLDEAAAR